MAETVLLDFEIPKSKLDEAIKAIGQARKEVEQLRAANKDLDKSSEAYTKNTLRIKELNGEIRVNERVLTANTKAQNANKGSVDQLRAELSKVSVEWAKLSKEERENTEAGKKLTKTKLDLTNELKRLEKQTGDTRRNVGNYSEGMKEALKESGLFAREQQALAVAQKAFSVATGGANTALKAFRIALISTGIGAIVVALGSLVAGFLSTQKGIDKVTAVTRPLVAIFEKMKGLVQDLAGNVFAGLAKILDGDVSGGIALIGQGVKEAVSNVGTAIKEGAEAGKELDRLQKQIERTEVDLASKRAALNAEFEKSKEIAQDQSKTEEERRRAAQAAIAAQNELLQMEQDFLDLRIEKKELENSLNDTSREDEKELNDIIAERTQLEALAARKRASANNLLNSINKKLIADEEKKMKGEEDKSKLIEKRIKEELQSELEAAEKLAREQIRIEGERYLAGELSREKYNERIQEMELESLQAQKEIYEQFGQDVADIDDKILAFRIANKKTDVDTTVIAEKSKLDQAETTINALASTMNQQTAVGKALASAQTAISTYKAATAALEPPPTGLGPVFGPILATLTTINGLANVAKINSTQIPKFATGVIGVDGPGTGTSDSISAKISAGESVMTAKATGHYAPLLAAMEASVGNRPNIGKIGSAKFASGIINAGVNINRQAARVAENDNARLASSLASQPIFVSITELAEAEARRDRAVRFSELEA